MPIVVRILLTLIPKDKKTIKFLLALLLAPFIFVIFIVSSVTMITHIPAIQPEDIEIYKEASMYTFTTYAVYVPWKELIAIDAVRLKQDFKKASRESVIELADRFIEQIRYKDEEGNETIYYRKKSIETLVNEMIERNELEIGDLEKVQRYLMFEWEKALEQPSDLPTPNDQEYIIPVVGDWRLSSGFFVRRNPITGQKEFHKGLDLAAREGTPVVASKGGRVVLAKFIDKAGNNIRIEHDDGTATRYLHLHSFSVQAGDEVEAGMPIGTVGSTGQSTGAHLHFEILIRGEPVDPASYLFR